MKAKPLKTTKSLIHILILFMTLTGYAQAEILGLNISKSNELSLQTSLMLGIPVDKGKTFFRLNLGESKITKFQDDTGKDLIMPGKGFVPEQTYESYNDYNSRAEVNLAFKGTPEPGARLITLQGTLILEYEEEGEEEFSTQLKMPGNDASAVNATDHGSIEIWIEGEATTDTDTYIIYRVTSALPVKSVTVNGGDDTEEAKALGLGISANQLVYKTEPEEINVTLKLGKIERVEIPLDMNFGVGF